MRTVVIAMVLLVACNTSFGQQSRKKLSPGAQKYYDEAVAMAIRESAMLEEKWALEHANRRAQMEMEAGIYARANAQAQWQVQRRAIEYEAGLRWIYPASVIVYPGYRHYGTPYYSHWGIYY